MKQIKTLLVAVVTFFSATAMVQAQAKVAHIDTQQLIADMPEMKSAQNQLEKLQKTYETEIQSMATELDNKMKQYRAEAASKTDEENAKRGQEVQSFQNRILEYRQVAEQEMGKKQENLIKPVMEKARLAIQKVARAKGYQYVIDATNGSGLILADGPDLMADVKKELGM